MTSTKTSQAGGFDLSTLAITAAASAGAAYVCSQVWAPGTLASAAFTPVIVALLKEALARPAKVVTRAVPVRGAVRSSSGPDEPDPVAAAGLDELVAERIAQQGEIPGRSSAMRRRGWQMAILTGLLGFVVCVVIITVPELVAGKSASGGGRDTTLFGGNAKQSERDPSSTTTTTTPTQTETVAPPETVTVPPPAGTVTVPPPETPVVPPEGTEPVPPQAPAPEVPETPVPQTPPSSP